MSSSVRHTDVIPTHLEGAPTDMTPRTMSILRTHDDRTIPAAGQYTIDPAHSSVELIVRHLMITKVRGRIEDLNGTITIDEEPERSHVEVELAVASLNTGHPDRDGHLAGPDFFDVANHPTIRFQSTQVAAAASGKWTVTGDLTIRGLTRPVVLQVTFEGANTAPTGEDRIAFSASTEVDRYDWGLTYNQALGTGGVLIGRQVQLELDVQATHTT